MRVATSVSVVSFKNVTGVIVAVITVLFVGKLCFFYDHLRMTRIRAWLSHDRAAQEQLRQFDQKWIEYSAQADMLSVQDFSAVIDLKSTVEKVHQPRRLPLPRSQLLELLAAVLLPLLPVLALQIPIKDLLALFRQLLLGSPVRMALGVNTTPTTD
jgi:hypothetical protein